ncbi:MAG: hypothetical protein GY854_19375 [Deltaproteobacteria bacterium]|nr:hypothetical protein [Deltaproteobacteria bacterium]
MRQQHYDADPLLQERKRAAFLSIARQVEEDLLRALHSRKEHLGRPFRTLKSYPFTTFIMLADPGRKELFYYLPGRLEPRKRLRSLSLYDDEEMTREMSQVRIPWWRGVAGWCASKRKSLFVDDLFSDLRLTYKLQDIRQGNRSLVMAPTGSITWPFTTDDTDEAGVLLGVFSPIPGVFDDEAKESLKRITGTNKTLLWDLHRTVVEGFTNQEMRELESNVKIDNPWNLVAGALARSRPAKSKWVMIAETKDDSASRVLLSAQPSPFWIRRDAIPKLEAMLAEIDATCDCSKVCTGHDLEDCWHPLATGQFATKLWRQKSLVVVVRQRQESQLTIPLRSLKALAEWEWPIFERAAQAACQGLSERKIENSNRNRIKSLWSEIRDLAHHQDVTSITFLERISDAISQDPELVNELDDFQNLVARNYWRIRLGILPALDELKRLPAYGDHAPARKPNKVLTLNYADEQSKDRFLTFLGKALTFHGTSVGVTLRRPRQNDNPLTFTRENWENLWDIAWPKLGETALREAEVDLREFVKKNCAERIKKSQWERGDCSVVRAHIETYNKEGDLAPWLIDLAKEHEWEYFNQVHSIDRRADFFFFEEGLRSAFGRQDHENRVLVSLSSVDKIKPVPRADAAAVIRLALAEGIRLTEGVRSLGELWNWGDKLRLFKDGALKHHYEEPADQGGTLREQHRRVVQVPLPWLPNRWWREKKSICVIHEAIKGMTGPNFRAGYDPPTMGSLLVLGSMVLHRKGCLPDMNPFLIGTRGLEAQGRLVSRIGQPGRPYEQILKRFDRLFDQLHRQNGLRIGEIRLEDRGRILKLDLGEQAEELKKSFEGGQQEAERWISGGGKGDPPKCLGSENSSIRLLIQLQWFDALRSVLWFEPRYLVIAAADSRDLDEDDVDDLP